jgi:hypothetical protein
MLMKSRKPKKYLPLFIVLFFFSALGGIFFLRSPVLVVTDITFYQLYGTLRFRQRGIMNSLELFRRVIPVVIAENAGPELAAFAVEGASRSARAVLFPYRYLEGARFYKDRNPDIPVLVMGVSSGSSRRGEENSADAALVFVTTDTVSDLYRAGLCAALLMGETRGALLFSDGILSEAHREAFREGLRFQGFWEAPVFADLSGDYSSFSNIGCVVVAGPAASFFERNHRIPIILFSWLDPALTPRTVKLIFDDSHWALAAEALRAFARSGASETGEILVSSRPTVLRARIEEKNDFRKLRELSKQKIAKN